MNDIIETNIRPKERRSEAYDRVQLELENSASVTKKPKVLPLSELHLEPLVFQQREFRGGDNKGTIEHHIESLVQSIKSEKDKRLDPVLIWSTGLRFIIIDGHHRKEAYKLFAESKGWSEETFKVPVKVFEGTLDEARIQSAMTNKKKSEALTRIEKGDASWRLVCTDYDGVDGWIMSKKQITSMGLVGESAIGRMRRTYIQLLKSAWVKNIDPMDMSWVEAQERSQGKNEPREYSFDAQETLSDDWSKRMGRALGDAPTRNPEAFLMALDKYSLQMMDGIREIIKEDVPYGFECDDVDDEGDVEGDF